MDHDIEYIVDHYTRVRVLVTGSRGWTDREVIRQALASIPVVHRALTRNVTVVHGAARGADTIAAEEAAKLGMAVEAHPADWERHGKAAGPIRNGEMVKLGADVLLAFPLPGSVGSWDCIRKAKKAGIGVITLGPREAAA